METETTKSEQTIEKTHEMTDSISATVRASVADLTEAELDQEENYFPSWHVMTDMASQYERKVAFLHSLLFCSIIVLLGLTAIWLANRIWSIPVKAQQMEAIVYDGDEGKLGFDPFLGDNAVEADLPPVDEVLPEETEEVDVMEDVEQVLETTFEAKQQATLGEGGNAGGTGDSGSGSGSGQNPPHLRWQIRYTSSATLQEYAAQLDFFKIEMGVLTPTGKLVYISNLSKPTPDTRTDSGAAENRTYFAWADNGRRKADRQLAENAKVDVGASPTIVHFYPPSLIAELTAMEKSYAGRELSEIKTTRFEIKKNGGGYVFSVMNQVPK